MKYLPLKLGILVVLLFSASMNTGCAYLKDRALDFADCFKLQVGWGLIADAEVRCTNYISTGAGLSVGMKWGFDGRRLVGPGWGEDDNEALDIHVGLPFAPFLSNLFTSAIGSKDDTGLVGMFITDYNIRSGGPVHVNPIREAPIHYFTSRVMCRRSHKSILLFDLTCIPRFRDDEDYPLMLRHGWLNFFDIEVGGSMVLGVRAGFSPGQFADFLLGWIGFDPSDDDDIAGKERLIRAVRENDFEKVKKLISEGVDVNGCALDVVATIVAADNIEMLKYLINNGADVNSRGGYGCTVLFAAEDKETIDYLVSKGAEVNCRNFDGETPLHSISNPDAAKVLIRHGADVNAKDIYGITPAYRASLWNMHEIIKVLAQNGADVNLRTDYGYTPLFEAVRLDYLDTVKVLIESGAEINALGRRDETPLDWAHEGKVQDYLRAHGAKTGEELEAESEKK